MSLSFFLSKIAQSRSFTYDSALFPPKRMSKDNCLFILSFTYLSANGHPFPFDMVQDKANGHPFPCLYKNCIKKYG